MWISGEDSVHAGSCTLILTHKRPCGTIDRRIVATKKRRGKLKSHFPRPVKGKRFINPCHILPVGITPFSYATNLIKVTSTSRLSQDKGDRFCCSSLPTSQHIAAIWFIFRVSSEQCGVLFFTAPGDIFKVPWENEGEWWTDILMSAHHSPH